jgi:predicted house-cleaning noncanonical NTP pyrophosphatase (MazG superfamily)
VKTRTFRLDKLVRDRIVEHHLDMGGKVDYKTLKGKKLSEALVDKLVEESKELKASSLSVGELADIKEILEQIAKNLGITDKELAEAQSKKAKNNGAFKKGHYISTVTLPAENKWAKYYAADPKRFPEVK